MWKKIFIVLIISLFLIKWVYALGIVPAIIEEDFTPNLEKEIIYRVSDTNKEIKIYAQGDLAEYVKFNKEKLDGRGEFIATLKLPAEIKPGRNRIFIVVEEVIEEDEEVIGSVIGTSVTIKGVIDINMPFPGKYLEISLESHDANIGETVDFELEIISWGKEDVTVAPEIEILSLPDQKHIETLQFKNREIKSRETIKLGKSLDTSKYNAGNYRAVATVDYGGDKPAKAESDFRIGELIINIVNYTRQIIIKDFQPFNIEIESRWNNEIDGVYARVFIFNESEILTDFKTSSNSLIPWERKNITGFFDTNNFDKGFYKANITLFYYGKDVGKSSSKLVEIEFIKEKKINILLITGIVLGIIILVVIAWILIKKSRQKNGRKTKDKKLQNNF